MPPHSHQRPSTLFVKPEWKLLPDPEGPRLYANVDNRLEVILKNRDAYYVALAIPTAWFTLARDELKIEPGEQVMLSVEFVERWYMFSALTDTNRLFDLWVYTQGALPDWIVEEPYRLDAARSAYRQGKVL